MIRHLRPALILLVLFTILTGLLYPAVVTGLAQVLFPYQANGSVIVKNDIPVGSELIGQPFTDPKYFWGRPSATGPSPYNASSSSGSNLSPANPDFVSLVKERANALRAADPENNAPIPGDLVTASGSGLDPHISVAAAFFQADRVARARGINREQVLTLVNQYTENRSLGIFGEPRVNVLKLNQALDDIQ